LHFDQISVSVCLLPLPRNVVQLTLTFGKVFRPDDVIFDVLKLR